MKKEYKELKLRLPKEENPYYKDNPEYFDELILLIILHRCNFVQILNRKIQKKYPNVIPPYQHLKHWIEAIVPNEIKSNLYSMMTKCFWIVHGMIEFPICSICLKSDGYIGKNVKKMDYQQGYSKYCCKECGNAGGHEKMKQTNLKRYGNTCSLHGKELAEMTKKTWIENYGTTNPLLSPVIKNRIKNTVSNFSIEKKAEIQKKKEIRCLEHYGVSHQFQSPIVQNKCKKTIKKHFGVDNFFKTAVHKHHMADPEVNKARIDKQYETKKKNGSFRQSKAEDAAYEMLKFIFPKLQRQYKSEEYPFAADFYDPSLPNVRFEFNGTWTHGKHAFDEFSAKDLLLLLKMLVKGTRYYLNAISTWIVRDPHKREIAKKNGISLIEFWNLEEVREYVMHYFDES